MNQLLVSYFKTFKAKRKGKIIISIDCTGPFQVGVVSDATDDNDAGFCLHYRQLPC